MKRTVSNTARHAACAALFLLLAATGPALANTPAATAAQAAEFNQRLSFDAYVGAGLVIPKEGNFDLGPAFVLGAEWRRGREAIFFDIAFAETDLDTAMLWDTDNVRHTTVRLGYKMRVAPRWRLGADFQTQRMDFGLRKLTGVTYAALVEYNPSRPWAVQFESAQVVEKSGIRFNSFSLMLLYYLHGNNSPAQ